MQLSHCVIRNKDIIGLETTVLQGRRHILLKKRQHYGINFVAICVRVINWIKAADVFISPDI